MPMPERWRQTFLAHADEPEHAEKVAGARDRVRATLARSVKPYIAYSGGKDSICVGALVLAHAPETLVWHWDYGRRFMPRSVEAEVNAIAGALGAANYQVVTSPLYDTDYAGKIFIPTLFRREFPRLVAEGHDAAFIGLRAEESGKRRRRIAREESIGPIPETWPIQDWTWRDVWAFIISRDLPYPAVYDERAALMGYDRVRMCTFFDPEFAPVGSTTIDGVLHWRLRGR